jgi:hypothetical protein
MKKVAICLRGAVAKTNKRFLTPESLYDEGRYVNYVAVYNSIKKHIIDCNPDYQFDFFIQCWNIDLKNELIDLYKPKSHLFENNNVYKNEIVNSLNNTNKPMTDFASISQMLAISKSILVMKNYIDKQKYINNVNINYDLVIFYRPDVLLFKDMELNKYNVNEIYVNAHVDKGGDFHFIMNLENSYEFIKLYGMTKFNNIVSDHALHGKIKMFVQYIMNKKLIMDDIKPGVHQEVLRKLKLCSIDTHHIPMESFYKYGLTESEILSYYVH